MEGSLTTIHGSNIPFRCNPLAPVPGARRGNEEVGPHFAANRVSPSCLGGIDRAQFVRLSLAGECRQVECTQLRNSSPAGNIR